jgi:beta-barrel assembly-enhancing protease
MSTRRFIALTSCAVIALGAVQPAAAQGRGGFSVSGKKGPFIQQVSGRRMDQSGGGGAMGLAADAVNQGQYQAARLRMPQTEAKVRTLLERVEAKWPYDKSLPLKVFILGVDYYNAYALPDGSIVVGLGLLEQAKSDDEVAFVLSHELGHIRLGHFAQQAKASDKSASRLGQAYVVGSALSGGISGGSVDLAAAAAGARAEAAGDMVHFLNTVVVGPPMSRNQEDEADALGFDLANLGSYSAESASARVFDTIQADEEKRSRLTESLQGQMKTELGRAVRDGSALSALTGGVTSGQMLRVGGRLALGMARGAGEAAKHRSPEERKKGIADYSIDAYPQGLPPLDEQTAWLDSVRSSPEYVQARQAVKAVAAAMGLRAEGKYAEAEASLQPALSSSYRDAPLILNEAARIRDSMGDTAGADALFRRAHASPDEAIDGYVDHVRMLYRRGRNEEALALIDEAVGRFNGDEKPFISLMVATTRQAGMKAASDQHFDRCMTYPDSSLKADCELAAGRKQADASEKAGPKMPGLGGFGGLGKIGGLPF